MSAKASDHREGLIQPGRARPPSYFLSRRYVSGGDSTVRMGKQDKGDVVSQKGSSKVTITGGCTLGCKALPGMVTHKSSGITHAAMADPTYMGECDAVAPCSLISHQCGAAASH